MKNVNIKYIIKNTENKRRKVANIEALETAQPGFANGISTHLASLIEDGYHRSLTDEEKWKMVNPFQFHRSVGR